MNSNVRIDGSSISDKVRKGAITGAVAAAAGYFLFGETGDTNFLGTAVPVPLALFGGMAASSILADTAHDYVLPHIPGNEKFSNIEAAALGIGVSGAASAYILNGTLGTSSAMNSAILGAGSYAAGEYFDSKFFGGTSGSLGYY